MPQAHARGSVGPFGCAHPPPYCNDVFFSPQSLLQPSGLFPKRPLGEVNRGKEGEGATEGAARAILPVRTRYRFE